MAFQQALCDTELWLASRDYTTLAAGRTGTSDTSLPSKEPDTPATSETHSLKIDVDRNVAFSGTINEDSLTPIDSPVNPSQSNTAEGAAVGVGLLDRFKLLGSKIFTAAAAVRAGAASAAQMESRWPHESKVEAGTMCVWSNAGEVVPFISSSSRTALPPFESIHCYFQQGVLAVSGVLHEEKAEGSEVTPRGKGRMILPPQTELLSVGKQVEAEGHGFQSDAGVTYFGIDCRNERERSLGLFPRVRHMSCIALITSISLSVLISVFIYLFIYLFFIYLSHTHSLSLSPSLSLSLSHTHTHTPSHHISHTHTNSLHTHRRTASTQPS